MPSVCSNASWKTWTPLDEHLVEMFPLFDQAQFQLVNVMNLSHIYIQKQVHIILSRYIQI